MTNTRFPHAGFAAALAILATAAIPATAQVTCANASLAGAYGIALDGAAFPATATTIGGPAFQKSIGLLTADGQGLLKATLTTSVNGAVTPTAYTGSYSIQATCTGSMTLNGGSSGSIVLALGIGNSGGNSGQSAVLAGTLASVVLSGTMARASTGCSASGLTAGYNWETDGEIVPAAGAVTAALAELIDLQFDGRGGITGGLVRAQPGDSFTLPISGSYSVNGDCTGAIHFLDAQGSIYNIAFVQIEAGGRMLVLQTDAGAVNSGVAVSTGAATVSGSIAQIASAGNWTTTITLVNQGATPAQAQLNFYDQNGNPMLLPLTFPQTPFSGTILATSVSRTLNPDATLLIVTTGPNIQAQTGWAQLISSGNISGHAVFTQSGGRTLQEAVVSIETRNPTSFVLPFDNTAGYNTGVAVANLSTSAANVTVIVRDDTGATLQTQKLTLPAQGQSSFSLADRFSQTVKKLGTVEFDTPAGGQISVLGLRFNPTGAFSTVPPLGE